MRNIIVEVETPTYQLYFGAKICTLRTSERALRNRVIKNKVSGCFRSELGAFCNDILSSVIETAKKQKVNLLDALNPAHSFAF